MPEKTDDTRSLGDSADDLHAEIIIAGDFNESWKSGGLFRKWVEEDSRLTNILQEREGTGGDQTCYSAAHDSWTSDPKIVLYKHMATVEWKKARVRELINEANEKKKKRKIQKAYDREGHQDGHELRGEHVRNRGYQKDLVLQKQCSYPKAEVGKQTDRRIMAKSAMTAERVRIYKPKTGVNRYENARRLKRRISAWYDGIERELGSGEEQGGKGRIERARRLRWNELELRDRDEAGESLFDGRRNEKGLQTGQRQNLWNVDRWQKCIKALDSALSTKNRKKA